MVFLKSGRLLKLLKQGYFVMPLYLVQLRDKFHLSMEDFVFLIYLVNEGEKTPFNPVKIGEDLNMSLPVVMQKISILTDLHLLEVKAYKNDKGIMEEVILLSSFYDKAASLLVEEMNEPEPGSSETIFEIFEREFGRTLSPMECEIIKAWMDGNISRELILAALKEATYNGVSNLRYIDKILYEWLKKGFKTEKDVLEHQQKRKEQKSEKPNTEVFDYNWFDDEE